MKTNTTALTLNSNFTSNDGYFWEPLNYLNTVNTYYTPWFYTWQDNKIEKSFKLVQKLIEKKLVKEPKTVKDFIELVNELTTII